VRLVWEHRRVSQPLELGHGRRLMTSGVAAAVPALLLAAAIAHAVDVGQPPLDAAADLAVAAAWFAAAAAIWPHDGAVVLAAVGVTWLLGSLEGDLALVHRGALAHAVLAYPALRLGSWWTRGLVAAAYVTGAVAAPGDAWWTLGFCGVLAAAAVARVASASGAVRQSRVVGAAFAAGVAAVLGAGAVARLRGDEADILGAYEALLVVAALVVAVDLRTARWSRGSVTGLVVDLGRRPVGGVLREQLARAIGDPTLAVAYVVDGRTVDEHGRPAEVPAPGAGRALTRVQLAGEPLAVLVHDRAALADDELEAGAASALGIAVANARLQAEVRARVQEVERSALRLRDAADAQRRQVGADVRAHVGPLLAGAAQDLRAGGAPPELLSRVERVHDQLGQFAAGLDPVAVHEHGLAPALEELARDATLPTAVSVPADRFPPAVEACVWFTCAEATANALKHAHASRLEITVARRNGSLHVEVTDDGVGGADPAGGSGLSRLANRVRAAGGVLAVASPAGGGTRVTARLDLGAAA
jgi:signal transduction histidine kinase